MESKPVRGAIINSPSSDLPIIGWWSGGVTSAVACRLAIDIFGKINCRIVFIDTRNEDADTYRFKKDCEKWYGVPIESITNERWGNINEVWDHFIGLNFAHGAICSTELKRVVRLKFQKENPFSFQVFGYDIKEPRRAQAFTKNYGDTNPIYPLLMLGYDKKMCLGILESKKIKPPNAYAYGFNNNNCLNTGCVQGGIGYWQKMRDTFPAKFDTMAKKEHELTDRKGEPVTMLKDQGKEAKESGNVLVFLKPHPDYPDVKDLSMMKGRPPRPLFECNGFCGTNDLERNPTEDEINYDGTREE